MSGGSDVVAKGCPRGSRSWASLISTGSTSLRRTTHAFDETLAPDHDIPVQPPMYAEPFCLEISPCFFSPPLLPFRDNEVHFFNVLLFYLIAFVFMQPPLPYFLPLQPNVIMIYRRVHFVFSTEMLKSKCHGSALSWFIGRLGMQPSWSVKRI